MSKPSPISFRDALRVWVRVGLQSFGGPAGQIAVMHRILVEEKRWVDDRRFLHALNYCMLLPGPEAQQLATYLGWLLHGVRGGLVAGGLFVLPGFVAILALSYLYAAFRGVGAVSSLLFGLKVAVLAVVAVAVIQIGRKVLRNGATVALAVGAFVALFFFDLPFPWVVLGVGAIGLLGGWLLPGTFSIVHPADEKDEPHLADVKAPGRSRGYSARVLAGGLILWWLPVALLAWQLGPEHVFVLEGLFFSKAAVVTFGGAYAVLAYIAQQAVERYEWLLPGEMLDGLGMAESTPGPLIMVVQFVGFMGAFRNPGSLDPFVAGTLGSIVTTWVTFVPCFIWIFLGAPYIERLRGNRRLSSSLSAITAAVVGVILNLAVWFALQVLFGEVSQVQGAGGIRLLVPVWGSLDLAALLIALGCFVALLWFRIGMLKVLGAGMLLGLLAKLWAG